MSSPNPQPESDSAATPAAPSRATEPNSGPPLDQRRLRRVNLSLLGIVLLLAAAAAMLRSQREVARWYLAAAKEEQANGNPAAAVALIEKAIHKTPDDPLLYRQLAAVHYQQKQYAPCLEKLTIAIDKRPQDPRGYGARGEVFRKLKRYKEAVRDADTILSLAEHGADVAYHDALNNAAYFRALAGEELQRGLRDAEIVVNEIRAATRSAAASLPDDALVREHLLALNLSLAATLDTRGYLHYRLAEVAQSPEDARAAAEHLESARKDFDEALDIHVRNVDEIHKKLLTSDPLQRGFWKRYFREAINGLGEMYYHRGLTLRAMGEDRRAAWDFERARDCRFDVDEGH